MFLAALTKQNATRRETIAERREYFANLAKSPEMREIFKVCNEHDGRRQLIQLIQLPGMNHVYLSPHGEAHGFYGGQITDDTLLKLDMDQIRRNVQQIYTNAANGKLPTTSDWAVPLRHWFSNIGK